MGASVSTNTSSIENDILTASVQGCPTTTAASNNIVWNGVNITIPPDCPKGSGVNLDQASVVDATCLLSSMQETTAKAALQLSAPAQAALGFAVSTNVDNTKNSLSQYTEQVCAGASTSNYVNWQDVTLDTCDVTIVQNATSNSTCQINATQDQINTIAKDLNAQASGGSIFGSLFGTTGLGSIIIIIVALIIVALIAFFLLRGGGNKSGAEAPTDLGGIDPADLTGGFNSTDFGNVMKKYKPYIILLIIALAILVIYLITRSKPVEKFTQTDIKKLNEKISQAKDIAGLNSQTSQYTDSDRGFLTDATVSDQINLPSESNIYPLGYEFDEEPTLDDYYQPLL